jgi:hypothetical protein
MNIVAKSSATGRGPRNRAALSRVAAPAALAIAALAVVSGCSPASTPSASSAPATTAATPASTQLPTAPSSPTATSAPAATPSASATPSAPAQGALAAKVTILDTSTGLVPGGSPVRFLVTVTNESTQTYSNILPLVSLGHCSCTANSLFPAGKLQERESTSNVWQTITYDVEGFGTDFLSVMQPGGIQMISPGGIATFEYRVSLSPASSAQVTRGMGSFNVTLIQLPAHAQIGVSPAGSAPVDVQSGQPPA